MQHAAVTRSPDDPAASVAAATTARERFERLYVALRDRICLLDYPPGTRLGEEILAAEFGISRTPLRRVLARLESEGLLVSIQGVGTMVTDVSVEELMQVYQLRMELAGMIGRLSPATSDAAMIAAFETLEARARALAEAPESREFARINQDFFHACMRCTESVPLREMSERLFYQTARIWLKTMSQLDLAQEAATLASEIAAIGDAVKIGDMAAAGLIRRAHISMSVLRLRRAEQQLGAPPAG
ncbi:GntR family transcriptional regulator [Acidimangrovimonas sediminis]|uniref:GntR family transcriptional regulator n=1 Tax=Acidimangrovimonas sediminis TaxID=2056283 RepID=UPI000C80F3AB|nr:GntR family transcriptional regulator [Acidimangrovimonas sediminis]